jgi:hypothetical protein
MNYMNKKDKKWNEKNQHQSCYSEFKSLAISGSIW